MSEEEVIRTYLEKFGKLPPNDAVISYDDELYQELMKKALETGKEITPETLEKAIGNKPYDYVSEENEEENTNNEDTDMEAEKIRNLLKRYGAVDEEIENFMTDLYETKDEMKDDEEDFNYLDGDTMAKLKATKEGQDLIINAPKMAKDELKKAIKDYLSK